MNIIKDLSKINSGDTIQICENGRWSDIGVIADKRAAESALTKTNLTIMNKPIRIIRKERRAPIEWRGGH